MSETRFTERQKTTESPYPREVTCAVCGFITYGPPAVKSSTVLAFAHIDNEHLVCYEGTYVIIPKLHLKCKEMFEFNPLAYVGER
jgi:hypothetical protein